MAWTPGAIVPGPCPQPTGTVGPVLSSDVCVERRASDEASSVRAMTQAWIDAKLEQARMSCSLEA
jgi:hypothetical protein